MKADGDFQLQEFVAVMDAALTPCPGLFTGPAKTSSCCRMEAMHSSQLVPSLENCSWLRTRCPAWEVMPSLCTVQTPQPKTPDREVSQGGPPRFRAVWAAVCASVASPAAHHAVRPRLYFTSGWSFLCNNLRLIPHLPCWFLSQWINCTQTPASDSSTWEPNPRLQLFLTTFLHAYRHSSLLGFPTPT